MKLRYYSSVTEAVVEEEVANDTDYLTIEVGGFAVVVRRLNTNTIELQADVKDPQGHFLTVPAMRHGRMQAAIMLAAEEDRP